MKIRGLLATAILLCLTACTDDPAGGVVPTDTGSGVNDTGSGGGEDAGVGDTAQGAEDADHLNDAAPDPVDTGGDSGSGEDSGGEDSGDGEDATTLTPCLADADCSGSDVCYLRETATNLEPVCRGANPGGGTLGQVCSANSNCANNFCLPTRFTDVCSVPCANDGDCGVAGYECGTVDVDLAGGGTDSVSMCVPKAPPACATESDCGAGLDCAIIENTTQTGLESVCVPATGGTATGTACSDDSTCQSLVCLNGFCAGPCTDQAQCSTGQLCGSETITKGASSGNFDVCATLGDQACTSSDDCLDGVRVCGQLRDVGGVQTGYCRLPNVGKSQLGEACLVGNDCREGICFSFASECTVVCDKNADCAASQECTTFGDLNFCSTSCSDNSDCGADRRCTINSDVIANELDQVCVNPFGADLLGAPCTDGSTCETGMCLTTTMFTTTACTADTDCAGADTCECPIDEPSCTTGKRCATTEDRCTNLCDDNSDCQGGVAGNPLTACSPDIRTSLPLGGTVNISACAQPDL